MLLLQPQRLGKLRLQQLLRYYHHASPSSSTPVDAQGIVLDVGPTTKDSEGLRTYRSRKVGRDLPLPPILDPIAINAKQKWRQAKPKENDEPLSEFQQELVNNVYAQALGTPVRQCCVTYARLPSHFLVKHKAKAIIDATPSETESAPTTRKSRLSQIVQADGAESEVGDVAKGSMYIGNNSRITAWLNKRSQWQKVITVRIVEWHAARNNVSMNNPNIRKGFVWDDDIRGRVLKNHRRAVVEALIEAGQASTLAPSDSIADESCVLVLRENIHIDFSQTASMVYDLSKLLRSEDVEKLLSALSFPHDTTLLAMTRGDTTVRAQLALERLQNLHGTED